MYSGIEDDTLHFTLQSTCQTTTSNTDNTPPVGQMGKGGGRGRGREVGSAVSHAGQLWGILWTFVYSGIADLHILYKLRQSTCLSGNYLTETTLYLLIRWGVGMPVSHAGQLWGILWTFVYSGIADLHTLYKPLQSTCLSGNYLNIPETTHYLMIMWEVGVPAILDSSREFLGSLCTLA